MERAVEVVRDAKLWLRSVPQGIKGKEEQLCTEETPKNKPLAIWSRTREPEVILDTDGIEKKKPKQTSQIELANFRERVLERLEALRGIPTELKEKIQLKLRGSEPQIEVAEGEEARSVAEIDFDLEYDIIQLHEHIVLIGGAEEGRGNEPTSTVEVYDCTTGIWKEIEPLPLKSTACYATAMTGVPGLVVVGGYGGWKALSAVQMYDWVTKQWRVLKHMRKRRWGCYVTSIDNGIVVAGGCDHGSVLNSVELYNVKKKEWFTLPAMLEPRCNFGGAFIGKKLLVAGGGSGFYFNSAKNSAEIFDGEQGKWTRLPPMKKKRYGCTAVAWKNKLIVAGGCDTKGVDIVSVEAFDLDTHVWLELPRMPVGYSLCRAAIVQNKLVVLGADGTERTAYAYDFELSCWDRFAELPQGRNAYAVAVIGV